MALVKPIKIDEVVEDTAYITSKTYVLDWEKGRIIGKVDGKEAVEQFIKKALLTPRYKLMIYNSQYGSELERLIKSDDDIEVIKAEVARMVKDAIVYDPRITDLYDFNFNQENIEKEELEVQFTVSTIFGDFRYEGVI